MLILADKFRGAGERVSEVVGGLAKLAGDCKRLDALEKMVSTEQQAFHPRGALRSQFGGHTLGFTWSLDKTFGLLVEGADAHTCFFRRHPRR